MRVLPVVLIVVSTLLAGVGSLATPRTAAAAGPTVVYFPVTGHHVADSFLSTWRRLGGLATFGYPLTEAMTDPDTGLTVQYFERERFEYHPENAGTEWEVQFALLGSWLAKGRAEPAFVPIHADPPPADSPSRSYFTPTGHYLAYGFKSYWEKQGGLRIFGYPISEELSEVNVDTGQTYTVQYFERARFEYHPEYAGTRSEVLLGRLGAQRVARLGLDTAPAPRKEGVPDYDESLWAPPPPRSAHGIRCPQHWCFRRRIDSWQHLGWDRGWHGAIMTTMDFQICFLPIFTRYNFFEITVMGLLLIKQLKPDW